ncbi:MAG: transcription elongation factor GreA [Proteobacteria bacterium]|nr:transcription elongation factor GreA [Pseudomonadota bacterium]
MEDKIPLTIAGKEALEAELKRLKGVERPAIIQAIEVARANGDLSENADYQFAKEKQSFIEGRILDIGDKLARAEVIDPSKIQAEKVVFGATVTLVDEDGKQRRYQIVGEPEADLEKGKISVSSPISRALLGKLAGDEAIVRSPKGEVVYEVSKVEYI